MHEPMRAMIAAITLASRNMVFMVSKSAPFEKKMDINNLYFKNRSGKKNCQEKKGVNL